MIRYYDTNTCWYQHMIPASCSTSQEWPFSVYGVVRTRWDSRKHLVAKKQTWKALIDCLCHSSYIRKVLANMLRSLKQEISLQQE